MDLIETVVHKAAAASRDEIAIVGLACRFPGAPDAQAYWDTMDQGRFSVTEVPPDRWRVEAYYSSDRDADNKTVSKWGGFMSGIDSFDAPLFQVSPREAELMDPQQRIMLELAWACVEDAGYSPSRLRGTDTGVYIGVCNFDYKVLVERSLSSLEAHVSTGVHTTLIPNRISYAFDLRGPSVPIDTACSSSLVALEQAVHALRRGDCSAALVGGVSVLLNPTHFISFSKAGMLSPRGVCRSFDASADGYVRGEGAAVLMLKRLGDAQRDGDLIHGLVKGVAVNHGGRVATVTSPNPFAQSQVIVKAFADAGISPSSVNYVEAHGTGTPKGDPIEINALVRAYASLAKAHGVELPPRSCAVGSVKTNIGHLEASAGVAGIVKVLLAMRHRRLPPMLHLQAQNPRIKTDGSPFHFVTRPMPWAPGTDGVRRAGVSSFGFGGVNAHVLLEEPPEAALPHDVAGDRAGPWLFVLSAKSRDSLIASAGRLAAFLASDAGRSAPAASIAWSLQRREPLEERLAVEASDVDALRTRLQAFVDTGVAGPGVWRGQARKTAEADRGDEAREVEALLGPRLHAQIAPAWVRGVAPSSWEAYWPGGLPARVRLPAYAFARRRYWFDDDRAVRPDAAMTPAAQAAVLHPLVHRNTSTLSEPRFSARLTGDEFFLADHRVRGERVLPGVAYLEMARAALRCASEPLPGEAVEFRQVVWARPVVVGESPVDLQIGLYAESADERGFVAYEVRGSGEGEAAIHGQGQVRLKAAGELPAIDLPALRQRLAGAEQPVDTHYAQFAARGIVYGPAHRAIRQLWAADEGPSGFEVLARLQLPACVADGAQAFGLHPSLMDAALQAVMACMPGRGASADGRTYVPFSMANVETAASHASTPAVLWAWLRSAGGPRPAKTLDERLAHPVDIDLCDADGRPWAVLRGCVFRALGGAQPGAPSLLMLKTAWHDAGPSTAPLTSPFTAAHPRRVMLAGFGAERAPQRQRLAQALVALPGVQVDDLDAQADHFEARALALLDRVRETLRLGPAVAWPSLQLVVPADGPQALHQALAGLLKTARVESPQLVAQLVGVDRDTDGPALARHLQAAAATPATGVWRVVGERALASRLEELPAAQEPAPMPWKEGGVYLVTGGAGALGRLFADEIARQLRRATVVLAGRSLQATVPAAPAGSGVAILYRPLDVTDGAAVEALVRDLVRTHGGLNGVIHAAGVLRDGYLVKKSAAEFAEVLAPKVDGLRHLVAAAGEVALDFFAAFSSIAAALGNAGQADYATANAYLDAFAEGGHAPPAWARTVSIGWPLWQDGGMGIDDATARTLKERWGMVPLRAASGLSAFYRALASGEPQVVVMEGEPARMRRFLSGREAAPSTPSAASTSGDEAASVEARDKVQSVLIDIAARLLKLPADEFDTRTELGEYGFDSIAYTALAHRIGERYGIEVSPTVFFDFPTLAGIAGFLLESHRERLVAPSAAPAPAVAAAPAPDEPAPGVTLASLAARARGRRGADAAPAPPAAAPRSEPIAIVGMSGRFPMARDLDTFWAHLDRGTHCIAEVPPSRWDWRALLGDPTRDGDRSDVKWGGFIDGVDEFDPLFFGISPREAQLMDPQQRLLLMHAWQAIEDAGHAASSLAGSRTGVFIGTASVGYAARIARAGLPIEGYSATGGVPSVGPNRLSYLLNLHGPSEPIETACSSSLVAIHRAVSSIEAGECDQALVGGVNTLVAPDLHISFNKAGMLARDGRCKTFSKDADGYVRGEGVGVLFLKRLSAARADGDAVHGLIRGSAENHGGRAHSLTSPNAKAQADVLVRAWRKAGVDPRTVGYLEAHGTGTPLGDPIEINGIKAAFQTLAGEADGPTPAGPGCAVGSVKTNIGHLELAAGVAGVIKVLLQFRHRRIAASLHCDALSPHIDLAGTPFQVATQARPWEPARDRDGTEHPLRAGVSSFGFGGVNAHVVLEAPEAAPRAVDEADAGPAIVPLSARNAAALRRQAENLAAHLDAHPDVPLHDLAYTLQLGRDPMDERLAIVATTTDGLRERLLAFVRGDTGIEDLHHGHVPRHREVLAGLAGDEDLQAAMQAWLLKRKYGRLLGLWVKGMEVDWAVLHAGRARRRVHAPTYPFAADRFWVPAAPHRAAPAAEDGAPDDAVLQALEALQRGAVTLEEAIGAVSTDTEPEPESQPAA